MSGGRNTLRLLSIAEQDLAEAITYIAADNPEAAGALLDRFEKALRNLQEHPHFRRVPDDAELLRLNYRCLIIDNFLVFYVIKGRNIT
ncbi:MAG: type II toxin-antitoxin system RelE/ParE family toxin, partial [Actinomycetota bacterium]